MVQLLDRLAHREQDRVRTHHGPSAAEAGLAICAYCGHSRRNHEFERADCARALCDCDRFCA